MDGNVRPPTVVIGGRMAEVSLFGNSPSVEGVNSEEIPEWVFCNQEGGRLDTNNLRNKGAAQMPRRSQAETDSIA
jgi:hypothetical protein